MRNDLITDLARGFHRPRMWNRTLSKYEIKYIYYHEYPLVYENDLNIRLSPTVKFRFGVMKKVYAGILKIKYFFERKHLLRRKIWKRMN